MEDKDRWSILSSVLLTVIASLCALTLLLRVDRVSLIESPRFTTGCGDWQQAYTKLHRQITSSRKQAKRLCVATTREEKGLYDRLTGYVTVFLVALVTDRAFLLHQPADVHARWEDIYEQKHVAWLAEQHLDYDAEQARNDFIRLDLWDEVLHYGEGNETEPDPAHMLPKADQEALHPDAATLVLDIHHGYTVRMLQNPHLGPKLRGMGLTPETAFGCAAEFLFPPKSEIFRHVAAEQAALQGGRSTLRIGLQVRLGDKMFDNSSETPLPSGWESNMFQATIAFWNCAEQIEEWAGRGYSNVLWYLASDSQDLRRAAKQRLGAKLVTNTEAKVEHSMHAGSVSSIQLAAAEQALLSRTDFQVVSMGSTFGRTAAMMSLKAPDSVYTIPPPYSQTRSCGRGEHDSLDSLAFVGLVRQKEDKTWHLGI